MTQMRRTSHTTGRTVGRILFVVVLAIITFIEIFPFLWVFFLSFVTNTQMLNNPLQLPKTIEWSNYTRAIETLHVLVLYRNSLIVTVSGVGIGLLVTYLSSFALGQLVFRNLRLQQAVYLFFIAGLAIPVYILLFPVYRITIFLHLRDTYLSLIIPYVATSVPFATLLFVGFFREFPTSISEAAIIDGVNLRQLIVKVVLPITQPVVATVLIFNFLYYWNEFPFAVTLLNKVSMFTISLGVSLFKGQYSMDYSGVMAATVLIVIPQLIVYAFFQRYIIAGLTAGAVKG